jgi:hypothetical protein
LECADASSAGGSSNVAGHCGWVLEEGLLIVTTLLSHSLLLLLQHQHLIVPLLCLGLRI